MRVLRNLAFAMFFAVVAYGMPERVAAATLDGCSSGSPAFLVDPTCPIAEFNSASCAAYTSCGNEALDTALETCSNYSSQYGMYMIMEAFSCSDPIEPDEPFDFSFRCAWIWAPCPED